MKMTEEIKTRRKEFVYDQYTRIVPEFKDYEKITKVKMIEEIYKIYSDYENIIDICTVRELKFLKMIVNNDEGYRHGKYEWERINLIDKFIVTSDFGNIVIIPEEIEDMVKKAIQNIDWKTACEKDKINELLVGYSKIQGNSLLQALISLGTILLEKEESFIAKHIMENKLFNYYVCVSTEDFEEVGEDIPFVIFNDYISLSDEINKQRKIQGKNPSGMLDIEEYKIFFYNDFNINKPVIKKFLKELNDLPFFSSSALLPIREYALLNINRDDLKESIKKVPMLRNINLTPFFELMDRAMDEMPSGALNGLTPSALKKLEEKEQTIEEDSKRSYVKQTNAHLSKKEASKFYKIYFALLEFTNQKYNIKPAYKIYKKEGHNPSDLSDIVDKLWDNKDVLVSEFCKTNPYRFNKEELQLASDFKKGIRETFIIVTYEKEYTAFMSEEKVYMVKGINSNIDEIIPYDHLPDMIRTTIIPFMGHLIYDGILIATPLSFGIHFKNFVNEGYESKMKYYHI